MQNSQRILNERLVYKGESNPLPHEMDTIAGVFVTESHMTVRGFLVVSGGTTNGTSLGENPGNLFLDTLRIQAFAAGKAAQAGYPTGTLVNLGPRTLQRRRVIDGRAQRYISDPNQATISGGAATYTLQLPFVYYWAIPWLANPIDTALDTGMFGRVLFTWTTGSRNGQFSGNDRTFDYDGVEIDVTHRYQRYNGSGPGPIAVVFDEEITKTVDAANTRLQLNKEFPPDGSCLDLHFFSETTNDQPSDGIINRLSVNAGSELTYDEYATSLKADQEEYIGDGSTTTTPRTGLSYVRLADDGLLSNAKNNIAVVADVSNPGTDRLLIGYRRCQAIPVGRQQQGGGKILSAAA